MGSKFAAILKSKKTREGPNDQTYMVSRKMKTTNLGKSNNENLDEIYKKCHQSRIK